MNDLALFDPAPEPWRSDPPVRRVPVRAHERRVTALASPPTARKTDPQTSHDAAARASVTADNNRGIALFALLDAGSKGLTDFELADKTGKAQTSIGVRRKELVTLGLVERAPVHPRPSPSGSPSIVWRITDAGRVKVLDLRGAS